MSKLILCDTCVVIDFINKNSDSFKLKEQGILSIYQILNSFSNQLVQGNLVLRTRIWSARLPCRSLIITFDFW